MFFLIPIGVEAAIKKAPLITLFLIVANVLIYPVTSTISGNQQEQLLLMERKKTDLEMRLISLENDGMKLFADMVDDMARQIDQDKRKRFVGPALEPSEKLKKEFLQTRERFKNGEIVPQDSPKYQAWLSLYQEFTSLEKELAAAKENFLINKYGFIPAHISLTAIITSLFLHGGLMHLIGNMLFLWLVGCCIEDRWGKWFFLAVYLVSGAVALFMHKFMFPTSTIPCIGASGAIAGVMGAFMVRHFMTKVEFFYFIWLIFRPLYGRFSMNAGIALPLWFGQQLYMGLIDKQATPGVAFWAHIGGFLFGTIVGSVLKFTKLEDTYIKPKIEQEEKELFGHPKLIAARNLSEKDRLGQGIVLLEEVIKEEPDNIDAHQELLKIYQNRRIENSKEKVVYEFNRIIAIYLKKHQKVEALLMYGDLMGLYPKTILEARSHYSIAKIMMDNGDFSQALILYKDFISQYADHIFSWRALLDCGDIYLQKLRQPKQALDYYQQSLAKNPPFEWIDTIKAKISKCSEP